MPHADQNAECTVFFLPGLGLDATSAASLADEIDGRFRVVGVNLLDRGHAASVDALADVALERVAAAADGGPFVLVGHSLGGKVAGRVMARLLAGTEPVFGLAGAVLLAPSPPSPEPMPDEARSQMQEWAAGEHLSPADAAAFLDDNLGVRLDDRLRGAALEAIVRQPASAWRDWLTTGSREDATDLVGTLDLPVTVLAGDADNDLGAAAQPKLLGDVYPRARFVALDGIGHLLPYEAPQRVAAEIAALWDDVASRSPRVPAAWGAVIASTRVDHAVRGTLARRALADDPAATPRAMTPTQLDTLCALAARLVPQGTPGIDLALRVDAMLADGGGDGWRPAGAPADRDAYRIGLDTVAAHWPTEPAAQDDLIEQLIADGIEPPGTEHHGAEDESDHVALTAGGIRSWFEDARNDLMRVWLAHPASLARVGYDGFAVGGTGAEPVGWRTLGAGEREAWEPAELGRPERGRKDGSEDMTQEDGSTR